MSIIFKSQIPNVFASEEQIRDQLIGSQEKYPTLSSWKSFELYMDSWKLEMSQLTIIIALVKEICSQNKSLDSRTDDKVITIPAKIIDIALPPGSSLSEYFSPDIKPYLIPLLKIKHFLDEERIDLICKGWRLLLDDVASYRWILHMMSNGKIPGWIYETEYEKCADPTIWPVLKEWTDKYNGRLNFYYMFEIFHLFFKYGTNYLPVLTLLKEEQKTLFRLLKFGENRLSEVIKEVNRSIGYQYQLDSGQKTLDMLVIEMTNGDFNIFSDDLSRMCMKAMKTAIDETAGAEIWFRTDGDVDSKNPIASALAYHSAMDDCGHSGSSMYWTFAQFRSIYKEGWKAWVYKVFLSLGIGWNQVSFETAYAMRHEDCATHKLKDMTLVLEQVEEFMIVAIENEWGKFVKILLEKVTFPLDKLVVWTYDCDDKRKNSIYHLLRKKWTELYPRAINLSDINFNAFVKFLWARLPYVDSLCQSKTDPPTDEDIQKRTYEDKSIGCVNNKDLHYITPKEKFDPYHFDKQMKEIGFLARVLAEFKQDEATKELIAKEAAMKEEVVIKEEPMEVNQ